LSSSGQLTLVNNGPVPVDLMVGVQGYLVSPTATEPGDFGQDNYCSHAPAGVMVDVNQ
jgi:hypothetical protein